MIKNPSTESEEKLEEFLGDNLTTGSGHATWDSPLINTVIFQNDYSFDVSADNTLDVQDSGASVLKIQTASISIDDREIRNAMETSLQNAKEDFKK